MHRGESNTDKIIKQAKTSCTKLHTTSPCKVVAINTDWLAKEGDFAPISQPEKPLSQLEIKIIMKNAKSMLKGNCLPFFEKHLLRKNHKAFAYALDAKGHVSCAEVNGQSNSEALKSVVIKPCETFKNKIGKKAPTAPCMLFSLNNKLIAKQSDFEKILKAIKNKPIDIFQLAKTGVPDELQKALNSGFDVNIKDKFGYTPLLRAIKANRFKNTKFLIANGADVLAKDNLGLDALNVAVNSRYNNFELIKYLVSKGANINTKTNRSGDSPLHFASSIGRIDVVNFLLEQGVDINVKNNFTETPLHGAADQGKVEVLKALISKGANINEKTRRGITPLDEAIFRTRKEAIKSGRNRK